MFKVPNENRVRSGEIATTSAYGNNGAFKLIHKDDVMFCIASDGLGWEHVSVSLEGKNRCPTWEEMCFVKKVFWGREDVVVQYHPDESTYVNRHAFCLHLWRSIDVEMPVPSVVLV